MTLLYHRMSSDTDSGMAHHEHLKKSLKGVVHPQNDLIPVGVPIQNQWGYIYCNQMIVLGMRQIQKKYDWTQISMHE